MLRREDRLLGVHPALAYVVRMLGQMTDVEVICGVRTQAEQDALYAAGKSKNRVSKHTPKEGQPGRAVDLGLVRDGKVIWEPLSDYVKMLDEVQLLAKTADTVIRYGHTWTTNPDDKPARFDDAGHIELADVQPLWP